MNKTARFFDEKQHIIFGVSLIVVFLLLFRARFNGYSQFFTDRNMFLDLKEISTYIFPIFLLPTGILLIQKKKLGWILFVFFLIQHITWVIFYQIKFGLLRKTILIELLILIIIAAIGIYLNRKKILETYKVPIKKRKRIITVVIIINLLISYFSFYPLWIVRDIFYHESQPSIIHEQIKNTQENKNN